MIFTIEECINISNIFIKKFNVKEFKCNKEYEQYRYEDEELPQLVYEILYSKDYLNRKTNFIQLNQKYGTFEYMILYILLSFGMINIPIEIPKTSINNKNILFEKVYIISLEKELENKISHIDIEIESEIFTIYLEPMPFIIQYGKNVNQKGCCFITYFDLIDEQFNTYIPDFGNFLDPESEDIIDNIIQNNFGIDMYENYANENEWINTENIYNEILQVFC